MSWNHRVIKTIYENEETYSIHEVHYRERNDDHPEMMTVNPVAPVADDLEGLRWVLEAMLKALGKPVLTEEDFQKSKQ